MVKDEFLIKKRQTAHDAAVQRSQMTWKIRSGVYAIVFVDRRGIVSPHMGVKIGVSQLKMP